MAGESKAQWDLRRSTARDGTRPGKIDRGVLLVLIQQKGMEAAAVEKLLYHESGLKGLSGISNDMRELEANSDSAA
jgi:acetate kinase